MTPDDALAQLRAKADPQKAVDMAAYHKADRPYLGVPVPVIDDLAKEWRAALSLDDRLLLASALWETDIHEARVAAAKLLTQARIRPDDEGAWRLIASWVPWFDAWAIADHVAVAGQKRLVWNPARLDEVEGWTTSDHMWTRRAALVMTLPWTRDRNAKPDDLARRERILGWAALYVDDPDWFIQKAVAWWLRDLSKRDPARVRAFLDRHGARMKAFSRREAGRMLT
ncbi:DNA alkylation repair protein [Palleronia sp. KMU-117]|uniref:DNA alkylation repair protein n=1 Tax=Palleronia sp. KMU-117 TaxID=3434108 RepID=UPI003D7051E2